MKTNNSRDNHQAFQVVERH